MVFFLMLLVDLQTCCSEVLVQMMPGWLLLPSFCEQCQAGFSEECICIHPRVSL